MGAWAQNVQCMVELPVEDSVDQAKPSAPPPRWRGDWFSRTLNWLRARRTGSTAGIILIAIVIWAGALYFRYASLIDARLREGPFRDAVNVYAAPVEISVGDLITPAELATARGSWRASSDGAMEVHTAGGGGRAATVFHSGNRITRIVSHGKEVQNLSLGAPLITTLSANAKDADSTPRKSEERILVTYDKIPPVLVQAILSAEDKRFFSHRGLDLPRMVKAAWVDFKDGRKEQGASTLTMQLVRGLWLEPDKLWMRKLAEAMMTIHLEREWSKEKIFETYANQVYLGRQAAYSIHGFGQGARMFFGKDLHEVTLPEAALLAGLVQRPSWFNPFRHPDRAKERRDLVLGLMHDNHYITKAAYDAAVASPVRVAGNASREAPAPYFLDLVNEDLQSGQKDDSPVRDVYSTLDLNLQHIAEESITSGMHEVDKLLVKRNGKGGPHAEAALIAIDPHTGEIKALVGGRDYGQSQLNRILAKRPPGSVFKPFVYAAALNTALSGASTVYTPATVVDDTPATFWSGGKPYEPGNFRGEIFGMLSLRRALAKSDNVAAVKVAQGIGYKSVVQMARRAGLNDDIRPTPAVALGAYEVTPLEMAGAYTVFANGGIWVKPTAIASLRNRDGAVMDGNGRVAGAQHTALDARVAWLMVNLLQEVMRSGTAASVWSRGFTLPAAGKTGTSHDGWFAGFTSQLLCVVWVGFDDYRELNLEGAKSALPIWTDFMKRASQRAPYRNARTFPMPSGIEQATICTQSGMLAGDHCPETRNEYFITGSEPGKCTMHDGGPGQSPIVSESVIGGTQ
jgi:penicillin-binding protein 1B